MSLRKQIQEVENALKSVTPVKGRINVFVSKKLNDNEVQLISNSVGKKVVSSDYSNGDTTKLVVEI